MTSRTHFCMQRGCRFELEDIETPAELEADGVTVKTPAKSEPAPDPELCPTCGNPFFEHPLPGSL